MKERDLFIAAMQMSDPVARSAYLDAMCVGNEALRQALEGLLAEHAQGGVSAAESPNVPQADAATVTVTADAVPASARAEAAAANVVVGGKYRLVEVIGEGGMGSVWRAQQTAPVQRAVALKLIKAGMDTKSVLARFEAERQALALMDHPNIAKVLDGGVHEGRPYFVMELVKGVPITEYCDHNKLTPPQRLELFVQVCQAIQHAHQKGIIHRDIKPSNVLIALYDDKPVVKVIDFGVAKATGGTLSEHTIDTGLGGVVGTPQYMSPEQATFNNLDIDTRSDVYALGVLLYELLTGTPPFSGKELHKKGLLEILRVVREDEPPRPSTKLSTADALPSISANRGTEPKKLTGLLRNELDWIVMKALEKDRGRRYETANGFAADVLRYLSGEAVQAHPPSRPYRLKKFVRRHRLQVSATSLVLITLLAGIVGTTVGLLEARKQAEYARKQEDEARTQEALAKAAQAAEAERANGENRAKLDAEAKRREAEQNLAFATKGNDILSSVFIGLDSKANFSTVAELRNALKDNLQNAVNALEGEAVGNPLVVAKMQNSLGLSLLSLGEAELAMPLFAKARATRQDKLGRDHPDTLASAHNVAACYRAFGKFDQAIPIFEESYQLTEARLGREHTSTLSSMNNLANCYQDVGEHQKALELYEKSYRISKEAIGPHHPETLISMGNLAAAYEIAGKLDLALPLFEETLKRQKLRVAPDHPDVLISMNNLANAYMTAGKRELALPLCQDALRLKRAKLGNDHPETIRSMSTLATCYLEAKEYDQAIQLYEEVFKYRKVKFGVDHPTTLLSMVNLANAYLSNALDDRALSLLKEAHQLAKARLGMDHPDTLFSLESLAQGYQTLGKFDEAQPLFEEALRRTKEKFGPDHPNTLHSMHNLAHYYAAVAKPALAIPLYEATLKLRKAKLGHGNHDTLLTANNLAKIYRDVGQNEQALPLFEEVFKLRKTNFGLDHSETLNSMNNLAASYLSAKKLDLAIPLFEELLRLHKAKFGPKHPHTLNSMNNLAAGYHASAKYMQALPLIEEAFRSRKELLGSEHPDTLNSMNTLAACYWALKQYDQSIPLFEALLTIHAKRVGRAHPNTQVIVSNLGVNYLEAGRPAQAIPLLDEEYQSAKELPALRRAGFRLLDAYTDAARTADVVKHSHVLLEAIRPKFPKESPDLAADLVLFCQALLKVQQFVEAETLLRECLAIREAKQPDDWRTFNTHSMLGGALLGQKKYSDAEPLLLKGYEGMKAREAKIPPQGATRIPQALDRLLELYTAMQKPDEVKKYQEQRAKYPAAKDGKK